MKEKGQQEWDNQAFCVKDRPWACADSVLRNIHTLSLESAALRGELDTTLVWLKIVLRSNTRERSRRDW